MKDEAGFNIYGVFRIHVLSPVRIGATRGPIDNSLMEESPATHKIKLLESDVSRQNLKSRLREHVNVYQFYCPSDVDIQDEIQKAENSVALDEELKGNLLNPVREKKRNNVLGAIRSDLVTIRSKYSIHSLKVSVELGSFEDPVQMTVRNPNGLDLAVNMAEASHENMLRAREKQPNWDYPNITTAVNPVTQWLGALPIWDRKERLSQLLADSLGFPDLPYYSEVGRLIVRAIVSKHMDDHVKFDYMPVLISDEGIGKSTWVAGIMGERWHTESVSLNSTEDAFGQSIQGYATAEVTDLASVPAKSAGKINHHITRQFDTYCNPATKERIKAPRRCILIATGGLGTIPANTSGGARRFMPIDCPDYLGGGNANRYRHIRKYWHDNREQVFAQALYEYAMEPDMPLVLSEESDNYREKLIWKV